MLWERSGFYWLTTTFLLAECSAESLQRKNFEIAGIARDGRARLEMAHPYMRAPGLRPSVR
jgi:hypothetical protein